MDIAEWQEFLASLMPPAEMTQVKQNQMEASGSVLNENKSDGHESGLAKLKQVQLKMDRLTFGGQELREVNLEAEQINQDWLINMENPVIKGQFIVYSDDAKPTDIQLEYLRLPKSDKKGNDALAGVVPQEISLINFSTNELSVGEDNFGSWRFNVRPSDKGALIENVMADPLGLKVSGDLDWRYSDGQHSSNFEGLVNVENVGDMLEAWGYSRSIESKDAKAAGSLAWQGSPAMFSLLRSSGELTLDSKGGRLLEIEGSADILRLFGIFNFSSLARRLRLDFSDLFKKGYSYDSLTGKFLFEQGSVQIVDSLVIDGPSAKFKIDGRTDLLNKQLDQEMIVVLPLGDNIPIAAAIVGAPQVGIPLYLLNKVFGDMFERFTSARYEVTGSWDNPKVELVKIFDNSNTKSESTVESKPDRVEVATPEGQVK